MDNGHVYSVGSTSLLLETLLMVVTHENTFFYKKLVYKKLLPRWPKFKKTAVVLCLRSIKKLFKVKSMDIVANMSLNLYS